MIPSELEELLHKEGYPIERLEDGTWHLALGLRSEPWRPAILRAA